MYTYSKSCIKIDNCMTDPFPVELGVKQGDNLSPNLFKFFLNDLPNYLELSPDPVLINDRAIHSLMYADDIILLSSDHAPITQWIAQLITLLLLSGEPG